MWKNTEDEILKAAVMKYGKNQWARISSLLVRKSPKQCKQRWYEWLDPSVKKTPWSREEEEKLLHLAKIMPTQWRTIAGCLEGRTASQCLEHYEKLLDQAQGKDGLDTDDPRRLRPGEIDPNPEVKPALPDPVDFDEDEKEMLQEARARLANTKGKKAKRKAREKTLDEAKRIAALQKRRELKAAGIHTPVPTTAAGAKKRRVKMVDVMAEVPFHKTAPQGFYDTGREEAREMRGRRDPKFSEKTLQKLEGDREKDAEWTKKKDEQRMKKLKQDNLPAAMAKIGKLNDAPAVSNRPELNLPSPQIANEELEQIAKAAARGGGQHELEGDEESGVTHSLMPQVDQTPQITPMRTPMAAPGTQGVLRDAQYLAAMSRETQTPLLVGGAGPSVAAGQFAAPSAPLATPNVLKTPLLQARTGRPSMATPLRTPDSLALNQGPETKKRRSEIADSSAGDDLFGSLAALPAPRNEYQILVPSDSALTATEAEKKLAGWEMVPDAADVKAGERQSRQEAEETVYRMQSLVVRQNLPRAQEASKAKELNGPFTELVEQLISFDNLVTPLNRKNKRRRQADLPSLDDLPQIDVFSAHEIDAARIELAKDTIQVDQEEFTRAWEARWKNSVRIESRGWVDRNSVDRTTLANALKSEFDEIKATNESVAHQALKLERKVSVLHQGYIKRADDLQRSISAAHESWNSASIDGQCFQQLLSRETGSSIPRRLGKMEAELAVVAEREQSLQRLYAEQVALSRK